MTEFKQAGASYAVLTTKHHDGFTLWPAKAVSDPELTTAHAATASHGHTDLVGEFKSACERAGLVFGVYYSWWEFDKKMTKEYMDGIVVPQIRELITRYRPKLWWFDGDWVANTEYAARVIDQCVDEIRAAIPDAAINDRTGHGKERRDRNWLGRSTYRVYSDREIPTETPSVDWEHVNTIGLSWGRNRVQTDSDYKPAAEIYRLYQTVMEKRGRFMINVGPDFDGTVCDEELQRLRDFGKLIAAGTTATATATSDGTATATATATPTATATAAAVKK